MEEAEFKIAYIIYHWLAIAMQSSMIVLLGSRLITELSYKFKDRFKSMQCLYFMIQWLFDVIYSITTLSLGKPSLTYINFYENIGYWYIIWFHFSNQLWWIILVIHLKYYKQMKQLHLEYGHVRSKIKFLEKMFNIPFIAFVIIWHALCFYFMITQAVIEWEYSQGDVLAIKQSVHWSIIKNIKEIMTIVLLSIIGLMLFLEVILYKLLMQHMKTELQKFYIAKKKNLIALLVISMTWLTLFLIFFLIGRYITEYLPILAYIGNYRNLNRGRVYTAMVFTLISNLPLNFYAIQMIKNIDFKLYLCYVFLDNQMIDCLKGCSIFLTGTPNIIYQDRSWDEYRDQSSSFHNSKFNLMLSEPFKHAEFGYATDKALYVSNKFLGRTEQVKPWLKN